MQQHQKMLAVVGPTYYQLYFRIFFLAMPVGIFGYAVLLSFISADSNKGMAALYAILGVVQLMISLRSFRRSQKVLKTAKKSRALAQ